MSEKKEKEAIANSKSPIKKIDDGKVRIDNKSHCLINCLRVKLNP
jgi:hypothetical protein